MILEALPGIQSGPSTQAAAIILSVENPSDHTWRLVLSPPADGPTNMALDESILEAVAAGESPPTLRLYAWNPPCLSLGHAQSVADIDMARLQQRGWDLVRRPTGGRAILHTDELTYAIMLPASNPHVAGGVLPSYRHLSQGLVRGLQHLGLGIEVASPEPLSPEARENPICFEVPSAYEIEAAGRKLIGSAQLRRQGAVLQHGTLPLWGDLTRICDALVFEDEAARANARAKLRQRAATVEELAGRPISWQEAAEAFVAGFHEALGLDLVPGEIKPSEQSRAEALRAERYAHPAWTRRI